MKPIFLTNEEQESLINNFRKSLQSYMLNGTISFSQKFEYENNAKDKAFIIFTPSAYCKMLGLLQHFNSEVAWHYVVERSEEYANEFRITDILVYKQIVTGSTVNTDQEEYVQFLIDTPTEKLNLMNGHGHSHVNMDTKPSSVDLEHQRKILSTKKNQGFYIFQIWNKTLKSTSFIYDLDNNIYYEDKDIEIIIEDPEWNSIENFVANAKQLVTTKTYTQNVYTGNYQNNNTANNKNTSSACTQNKSQLPDKKDPFYMNKDKKPDGVIDYDSYVFGEYGYD